MAHPKRPRSSLLLALAGITLVPFAVSVVACGGGNSGKPPETPSGGESSGSASSASETADGGGSSAAETTDASPAPSETASATPAPTSAGSMKASPKNDPSWAACHQAFKPKGKDKTVAADVAALAKSCAKATKLKQVGKTITGKQSDSGPPQTFPLKAHANKCYRVFAQAGDGVKNLNVAIKDSTGATAGEDATDSSTAIVLDDGAVCFKEADTASVVVSVGSGSGSYALQIWGD